MQIFVWESYGTVRCDADFYFDNATVRCGAVRCGYVEKTKSYSVVRIDNPAQNRVAPEENNAP